MDIVPLLLSGLTHCEHIGEALSLNGTMKGVYTPSFYNGACAAKTDAETAEKGRIVSRFVSMMPA